MTRTKKVEVGSGREMKAAMEAAAASVTGMMHAVRRGATGPETVSAANVEHVVELRRDEKPK